MLSGFLVAAEFKKTTLCPKACNTIILSGDDDYDIYAINQKWRKTIVS